MFLIDWWLQQFWAYVEFFASPLSFRFSIVGWPQFEGEDYQEAIEVHSFHEYLAENQKLEFCG